MLKMLRKRTLILFITLCFVVTLLPATLILPPKKVSAAVQATYYVSATGSDSNPGTEASPFLTIAKARDVIRTINSSMTGDIVVKIREGIYTLSETLAFDDRDSGTNGYNVIYMAYPGEKPVISGGTKITGWSVYSGSIWRAYVGSATKYRQFYVNTVRAVRAKSEGTFTGTGPAAGSFGSLDGIVTNDAAIPTFTNKSDIELVYRYRWNNGYELVDDVVAGSGNIKTFMMKQPYHSWRITHWHGVCCGYEATIPSYANPFYIENAYELLDQPGEWYYNRTTGYMYYMPKTNEDLSTAETYVPELEKLVEIKGRSLSAKVNHMKFEGLTFRYGSYLLPSEEGMRFGQADQFIQASQGYITGNDVSSSHSSYSGAGYESNKAFDDDLDTFWTSSGGDTSASLTVDMGHVYRIESIEILGRRGVDQEGTRKNFEIRASNDPTFSTYAVIASQGATPFPYEGKWTGHVMNNTNEYRYVRAAKTDGTLFVIPEMRIYLKGYLDNIIRYFDATASSYAAGHEPTQVTDDIATGSNSWISDNADANAAVTITMEATHQISKIEIVARQDLNQTSARQNFEVWASTDSSFATGNPAIITKLLGSQGSTPFAHQGTWSVNVADVTGFQFIRVKKTDGQVMSAAEIMVTAYRPFNGNKAALKTVSVSSTLSGFPASQAVDKDTSTLWSSSATDTDPWIVVDLGKEYHVNRVELVSRQDMDQPSARRNFRIDASKVNSWSSGYVNMGIQGSTPFVNKATYYGSGSFTMVRYIRISKTVSETGLSFAEIKVVAADLLLQGNGNGQWDTLPGNIRVQSAEYIQFERNIIEDMGANGLQLVDGVNHSTIRGNIINDTSGSGISVGSFTHMFEPQYTEVCRYNAISNNVIRRTGQEFWGSLGIMAYYAGNLQIVHNDIADVPYSGVQVGWGWVFGSESTSNHDNQINYNKVFNSMNNVKDGGGIYVANPQPDSEIIGNYIAQANLPFGGIYPDDGSAYQTINNNVVERVFPDDVNIGYWLFDWSNSTHDLSVDNNYTTTSDALSNGTNISVTNTHVYANADWPSGAQDIINGAGLEAAYSDLLPENAAMNKTATASSSVNSSYLPDKANDIYSGAAFNPNIGTSWVANGTAAHWWQTDLGSAYRLSCSLCQLQLTFRQDADNAGDRRNFEIRASNDPAFGTYTVLGSQGNTSLIHQKTWILRVNDPNKYRYIRAVKTVSNETFAIADLKVMVDVPEVLAEYSFEESSGSTVNDTSGNINHGSIVGTVSRAAGFAGNALTLNGSSYVEASNSASLNRINNMLEIDLWVYPTTSGSTRRLVDKSTAGGADGFLLDLVNTNSPRFIVENQIITSSTVIPTSQWTHIKATYLKNDKLKIYLNGILDTEASATDTNVPHNTLTLRIGADSNAANKFTGKIDEVKVKMSVQPTSIAKYSFEEASGSTVNDTSGNPNNGTITGTVSRVTGQIGNAISMNGSTYVTVPDAHLLDLANSELAIDLWVYPTTSGTTRRLVDKETAGGTDGFLLDLVNTNSPRFIVGSQIITSSTVIPTNQWSHIRATYLKNHKMRIYVNDALDTEASATSGDIPQNALLLRLGADSTGSNIFTGKLDEVKLDLTAAPVSMAKYSFEESSGSTVNDSSGNANNGSITGTVSRTTGQIGNALSLNGSSYVNTPNADSLNMASSKLMIDLWVYPTTSGTTRRLVDKGTAGGTNGFLLDLVNTNSPRFIVGSQIITSSTTLTTSVWTHLQATYQQNGKLRIYINGVLDTEASATNTRVPGNTLPLRLGADSNAANKFTGLLDEVTVRSDMD